MQRAVSLLILVLTVLVTVAPGQLAGELIVNGKPLSPDELSMLRRLAHQYRVSEPQAGRYWYDSRTGLWGYQGQPAMGMILPGLRLGGRLAPNASNGNSGVFVNGRELSQMEVQFVGRCTKVLPGRYWLEADGTGGYVGEPASFNLVRLCNQRRASGALGSPGNRGWYGSVIGGGGSVGAIFSGGMGVTCGPDGGCLYSH